MWGAICAAVKDPTTDTCDRTMNGDTFEGFYPLKFGTKFQIWRTNANMTDVC